MFCSKCGKEIRGDSVFCYSCGSKVEENEKQDTVTNTSPVVVNKETPTETRNSTQETINQKSNQTVSSTSSETNEKYGLLLKNGIGWVILLILYGSSMTSYFKNHPYPVTILSMIILFSSLILLLLIYFRYRSYLLKKDFWRKNIDYSSLLSGIISYFLVGSLVVGSINYLSDNEKRKEIEKFMGNYKGQIEMVMKQEIEYSKIMKYESQNVSELKDKISKINEYRDFQQKKNKTLLGLINFMRETNSKYKNDKSVNEQIDKLEKVLNNSYKTSVNAIDFYKEYLITGNEKYFALYQQGYEKLQSDKDEITRLTTSIGNSL
jgi:hypothetical protein